MFEDCYCFSDSIRRIEWPAGGVYLDQENIAVVMFNTIESEIMRIREREAKK